MDILNSDLCFFLFFLLELEEETMSHSSDISRLQTHDIEIGVTDALQRHASRHVAQHKPVSQRVLNFERRRPRWLRECVGEATGVFLYV